MAEAISPTSPTAVAELLGTGGAPALGNLGGSERTIGGAAGDLAAKLAQLGTPGQLMPGDTIVCPAGAAYSAVTLPARSDAGWIAIVSSGLASLPSSRPSSGSATNKFRVNTATIDTPAIDMPSGTQGWWIAGAECTSTITSEQVQGMIRMDGGRGIVDRCFLHGAATMPTLKGTLRAILTHGTDLQVWNTWMSDIKSCSDDAQAIWTASGTQRLHVEGCELQSTGENMMLCDQGCAAPTLDVVVKRSHFFKPLTWRYRLADGTLNPSYDGTFVSGVPYFIKNLFEVKWAYRTLLEGNILENNWGGQGQPGDAIVINSGLVRDINNVIVVPNIDLDTHDLNFQYNTVVNIPMGVVVQTYEGTGTPPTRIRFADSLFQHIAGRLGYFGRQSTDVCYEHNTCVPQDGADNWDAFFGTDRNTFLWANMTAVWPRLTIRWNVLGYAAYGLTWDGHANIGGQENTAVPDRDWRQNAVLNGIGGTATSGVKYFGTHAATGVDATTGRLSPSSPLKVGNADGGSDGFDLGVRFAAFDAAQGAPGPPVASFTPIQTLGTRTVVFQDTSV